MDETHLSNSTQFQAKTTKSNQPAGTVYTTSLSPNQQNKNRVQTAPSGSIHLQSGATSNQMRSNNAQLASTATTYVEQSALERLKSIQNLVRRNWQGIFVENTGRPGTANIVNKKRYNPTSEIQMEDEERFKLVLRMVSKLKEIDEERQVVNKSETSSNFFVHNDPKQKPSSSVSEYMSFKTIKENQLLANAPPTIGYSKSYQVENSELLYKIFRGETRLVRSMLEANGFAYTESHEWNVLWSNSSCKSYLYEGLNEYQKINHFPSSNEITRKDKLCQNVVKMQEKFGKHFFDFIPDTYVLPDEFGEFYAHYQKLKQSDPKRNVWIVKPANLSRGRGIYLIDDISEVNVDDTSVISRYITNPLLINGHKFDLRIYVVVTSFDPLRIYVYKEGLARFASEQYSAKINKDNKYVHLTNYSINKKNDNFVQPENLENDDFGFKWSLGAFCKHLETIGIDMNLFWSRIYDVIIKSIISGENQIFNAVKKTCIHRTNCFELFGYDILIDSDLKPWLVEINLSPSLACESALDLTIKTNLIADTLQMVGVKRFDRKVESQNKMKNRMKSYFNRDRNGLTNFGSGGVFSFNNTSYANETFTQQANQQVLNMIEKFAENDLEVHENKDLLRKLCTVKHKEILRESLAEYTRKGNFIRIYPAKGSENYDVYFTQVRPLNKFLYKMLYQDDITNPKPTKEAPKLGYKLDNMPQSYEFYKNQSKQPTAPLSSQPEKEKVEENGLENEELKVIESDYVTKESVKIVDTLKNNKQNELAIKQRSISSAVPANRNRQSLITNEESKQTSTQDKDEGQIVTTNKKGEKVLVTGDDILIEYCERLVSAVKQINETMLKVSWRQSLEKFIYHKVWHSSSDSANKDTAKGNTMWGKIETRLNEMKDRRQRLIKNMYKKEGRLGEFEHGFKTLITRKSQVIRKFSNVQLENLLKTSTKNVAQEIVNCLIPFSKSVGLLVEMDQLYNLSFKAREERKRQGGNQQPSDTENSMMANAETEDDELSFINHQNRVIGKQPSKKIIFNAQNSDKIMIKETKNNNFFKDTNGLQSPSTLPKSNGNRASQGDINRGGSVPPKSANQSNRQQRQMNMSTGEGSRGKSQYSNGKAGAVTGGASIGGILSGFGYQSTTNMKNRIPDPGSIYAGFGANDNQLNRMLSGGIGGHRPIIK